MSDTEHAATAGHAPPSPYCLNCHYTLPAARPRYCGHCGQETDLHPPSVREMLTEYVGHYVAFDGPLWRTLWALVMLPGHLTLAYFHGRRRRYVLPLRVYLSASFLFFVGSHLLSGHPSKEADEPVSLVQRDDEHGQPIRSARPDARASAAEALAQAEREAQAQGVKLPGAVLKAAAGAASGAASAPPPEGLSTDCDLDNLNDHCSGAERWLARVIEKAQSMNRAQWEAKLWAVAPYGMLAIQPFFATLLLLMFAGSGRRYAEHFVFSLHSHSLWFLALLAANAGLPNGLLTLAVFWHGTLALRRVYGLSRAGAIWRGLLLSVGYFVLLILVLLIGLLGIAMMAH